MMTVRQVVHLLMECDMDADVQVFNVNGNEPVEDAVEAGNCYRIMGTSNVDVRGSADVVTINIDGDTPLSDDDNE